MKLLTGIKKGLIAASFILFAHTAWAQSLNMEVSIPGGSMTYSQIFDTIEAQTGVWFGYSNQELDIDREVSLPGGKDTLGKLLDRLFDGTSCKYTFTGTNILILPGDAAGETDPVPDAFTRTAYAPEETRLPVFALKSNLLYDLTATINLGAEIGLAPQWTLEIPFNFNAWKYGNGMRLTHWGVQPEIRYWTCQRFDGWFFGLHGHYAKFNVGAFPDRSFISENMQKNRYEGHLYGGGISAGYSWILHKRWSLEATVGVGYARLAYEKYPCAECGTGSGRKTKDYFGPTRAGVSLIFMIK